MAIPEHELHYADPAINDEAQSSPISWKVDRIHHPTLGFPALLDASVAETRLPVILSLPTGVQPSSVRLTLVDRHGGSPELPLVGGAPEVIGPPAPAGSDRQLWQLTFPVAGLPCRLFDLRAVWGPTSLDAETQPNAVRIFERITGTERVVFCGDTQYHLSNNACFERFIDRMNRAPEVAWIAVIGDICDNNVGGPWNIIKLAAGAEPGPVHCHYFHEFRNAHAYLSRLNKPVVLVAGNHDGMAAYREYREGQPSDVYLGPDPQNDVAYDGLHYYRRTFGPLCFRFDWHKTRYFSLNSFELTREQRLGYHAIVANWGGWVRPERLSWLKRELEDAAAKGLHKVFLMHHDPRGGSVGQSLGRYHVLRRYDLTTTRAILGSYVKYFAGYAGLLQQEWMQHQDRPLDENPVRKLLELIVQHGVWAVIMGHDNLNWVESYSPNQDLFEPNTIRKFPMAIPSNLDPDEVDDARLLLKGGDAAGLVDRFAGRPDDEVERILEEAVRELERTQELEEPVAYAPDVVKAWGLTARAPLHFVHVDDLGAYKHSKEAHFKDYGHVAATLHDGRPIAVQSHTHDVPGVSGPYTPLDGA